MDFWKSFTHKLQLARQLTWGDWLVLAQAWWMLLGFRLALRWVQFNRLEAFTCPAAGITAVPPGALAWARRRQMLVSLAARLYLPAMTCLPRALTLRRMLSRHAIPAQLRIGANKTSTGIIAHAWVELDGDAIGEPEDIAESFKVLQGAG
jgi:hypothetical protein